LPWTAAQLDHAIRAHRATDLDPEQMPALVPTEARNSDPQRSSTPPAMKALG
jgi:hypothetical protein